MSDIYGENNRSGGYFEVKSILYFAYFVKTAKYKELMASLREVNTQTGVPFIALVLDMLLSSFRYGASFADYFVYSFYSKTHAERDLFTTSGRLHDFHESLNGKANRHLFRDKALFNDNFRQFIKRDYLFLESCTETDFALWLEGKSCIIAKPNDGSAGRGVEKIPVEKGADSKKLLQLLRSKRLDLVEDWIEQHPDMAKFQPKSVNTVRVNTVNLGGKTDIVVAVLRMSIDYHIDSVGLGGLGAPIDVSTGVVFGPGVSRASREKYDVHPKTSQPIVGFEIPFWPQVLALVDEASRLIPGIRTVGWDIAITENGPELIEGNDNWSHRTFQEPYQQGRQRILEEYMTKAKNEA